MVGIQTLPPPTSSGVSFLFHFHLISWDSAFKAVGGKCLLLLVLIMQRPLWDVRVAQRPGCRACCGGKAGRSQDCWLLAQAYFWLCVTQKVRKIITKVLSSSDIQWFAGTDRYDQDQLQYYNPGIWMMVMEVGDYCHTRRHCLSGSWTQKLYNGLKLGLFPNSNDSNTWMEACNQLVGWEELFDFLTMSLNQLLKLCRE